MFSLYKPAGGSVWPTSHALSRAFVKWNVFYSSSNGFSLLIKRLYVVCIYSLSVSVYISLNAPLETPSGGISVTVWPRKDIRAHVYEIWMWDLRDNDSDFQSEHRIPHCLEFRLFPDLETVCCVRSSSWGMTARRQPGALHHLLRDVDSLRKVETLCHTAFPPFYFSHQFTKSGCSAVLEEILKTFYLILRHKWEYFSIKYWKCHFSGSIIEGNSVL